MNVSIFGLGYVGAVTAGCLMEKGHRIIGVDVQAGKISTFASGQSPIVEPELDQLLREGKASGLLSGTTDAMEAIRDTQVSIVCVGTPSQSNGRLNLDFVRHVAAQINDAILKKAEQHVLIFRSTMLPGSTRSIVTEMMAACVDNGLVEICYCPEFLREGTAVADFRSPSLAVVGTQNGNSPKDSSAFDLLGSDAELLNWEGAEMIKYTCNYFHAIKVGFANEIGRLSKHLGVDGARVMDVVCRDTRLNISRYYMRPGNPFGGSCLPKDVSALSSLARMEGVNLPLLENTLATNTAHFEALIKLIMAKDGRRVGILGLAFKADTDDLRGSPMVGVAEALLGRGYEINIFDPSLNLSRLTGANQTEINRRMPHLARLLRDSASEVVAGSDTVIAAQKCATIDELASSARSGQWVIDVNGWPQLNQLPWSYEGSCW
ncbi:MAG: UDP-glucose/GDP-mannose dehydrogenase family protein [Verrucomicrobiaceae bacterium]|nr:UDP-glucose/GDP-mannose dehydrogenase family protein [Verrucomicrobiaceae bacterium]